MWQGADAVWMVREASLRRWPSAEVPGMAGSPPSQAEAVIWVGNIICQVPEVGNSFGYLAANKHERRPAWLGERVGWGEARGTAGRQKCPGWGFANHEGVLP